MAAQSDAIQLPAAITRKHRTMWGDTWIQFRKHKLAMIGFVILVLIILFILIGPIIYPEDPEYIDFAVANLEPGILTLLPPRNFFKVNQYFIYPIIPFVLHLPVPIDVDFFYVTPDLSYPFGTDNLGRDQLARNMFGGRISLAVGVAAMLVAMTLGSLIGALAGYYPKLDGPLMRFTDMMLAMPILPLLLVIILLFRDSLRAAFGPETGIFLLIVFVIGILGWMPTSRVVRAQVLSVKEKEFVEAAISVGTSQHFVLVKHVFPNILSPIIVAATLSVATAILTESALSFLGLGFPSDVPTWGRLLFDGKDFLVFTPWVVIWPGLFISLVVLGINFMGDGLRDALDPRLRDS